MVHVLPPGGIQPSTACNQPTPRAAKLQAVWKSLVIQIYIDYLEAILKKIEEKY
jgi:hypothetical protein